MKYSYEQRLVIVQRVKQGEAIAHLSKEYNINETQILAWVRMWDKYGRAGLEKQPHCRPTPALKEKVVRLIGKRRTFGPCKDRIPYWKDSLAALGKHGS